MDIDDHLQKSTHLDSAARKNTPHRHSRITKKKQKHSQKQQYWQPTPQMHQSVVQVTPLRNRQLKLSLHNQENDIGRSQTEAKKKEKDVRTQEHPSNIFKLPSSSAINPKIVRQDLRLPTLEQKRHLDEDFFNPERKQIIKIPIDRLKPLPADEIKRRFMLKYQL